MSFDEKYESWDLPEDEGNEECNEQLCLVALCKPEVDKNPRPAPQTELERRVEGHLVQMNSEEFAERERGFAALRGMGRDILPMLAREITNPRSTEVRLRCETIYGEIAGAERITFNGNVGTDGVGRLREIRDQMSVAYERGGVPGPNTSTIAGIGWSRGQGWAAVRQGDGTYTISSETGGTLAEGIRQLSLDARTGNVRVVLNDGSPMIIPPGWGPRGWVREGDPPLKPPED